MKTKDDLNGLHLFHYGKPVGEGEAKYPADPLKIETAPFIVGELVNTFRPKTYLDLGCGTGIYVEEFARQDVSVIGVEGNLAVKQILKTSPTKVIFSDLRAPLPLKKQFELVTCFEVVEHIEPEYVDILVQNLTLYCRKWLIITSGEDSKGKNREHVNEQAQRYWIRRIKKENYRFERRLTRRLRRKYSRFLLGKGLPWFGELLLVFSNKKNVANHRFLRRVYNRLKKFLSLESKDSEKTAVGSTCDHAEIWAQYPSDAIPLDGLNRPKLGILKNESNQHEMYVKACIDLDVPFEEIDITSDAWIEEVKRSDCEGFLVRPPDYSTLANTMCKERVIILANTLQKIVFPSVQEILLYENKRMVAYWLQANKIPHPRTNIFYDKEGALIFAKLAKYPLVYKTALGSAGMGVRFLRSYDEAEVLIEQAFCEGIVREKGDPRDRSWGHVLFQEYIEGGREFRIIRIGDSFFGHEKLKKNGMHSGSNLARWGPPPRDCLDMCYEISEKGNFRSMCFDVLLTQDGLFLINELHCIFGAYNPSQMYIDDRPGRYQRVGTDWVFEEGLFCRNACANLQVTAFLRMLNTAEREITL